MYEFSTHELIFRYAPLLRFAYVFIMVLLTLVEPLATNKLIDGLIWKEFKHINLHVTHRFCKIYTQGGVYMVLIMIRLQTYMG